jgi:hypothetical protein
MINAELGFISHCPWLSSLFAFCPSLYLFFGKEKPSLGF